jgi:two-component system phosphoglycerate transport system sensor histidine kinase PgtB
MLMSTNIDLHTITIVSELIRGLRHELGNLTTVLSYDVMQVETVLTASGSSPEVLDDLKTNLDGLNQILSRLKQYPQPTIELVEVDLSTVLLDTIDYMRRLNPEMTIHQHLPNRPLLIRGDDRSLYSVFANIFQNASEANRQNGTSQIDLSLTHNSREVMVSVGDRGIGFAEEVIDRAFQPSVTTRITDGFMRGLGLGLFSAEAVIRLHGGAIWIENRSEPPGALVTVRLPLLR